MDNDEQIHDNPDTGGEHLLAPRAADCLCAGMVGRQIASRSLALASLCVGEPDYSGAVVGAVSLWSLLGPVHLRGEEGGVFQPAGTSGVRGLQDSAHQRFSPRWMGRA